MEHEKVYTSKAVRDIEKLTEGVDELYSFEKHESKMAMILHQFEIILAYIHKSKL